MAFCKNVIVAKWKDGAEMQLTTRQPDGKLKTHYADNEVADRIANFSNVENAKIFVNGKEYDGN